MMEEGRRKQIVLGKVNERTYKNEEFCEYRSEHHFNSDETVTDNRLAEIEKDGRESSRIYRRD
jgi:hypothetical protein